MSEFDGFAVKIVSLKGVRKTGIPIPMHLFPS